MILEEKRERLKLYCASHGGCSGCKLDDGRDYCYSRDSVVDENYEIVFGKSNSEDTTLSDFLKKLYIVHQRGELDKVLGEVDNPKEIVSKINKEIEDNDNFKVYTIGELEEGDSITIEPNYSHYGYNTDAGKYVVGIFSSEQEYGAGLSIDNTKELIKCLTEIVENVEKTK